MAARKKKKKATARKSRAVKSNVVVGSKVKEAIKAKGVRMAGDFSEALNAHVHQCIADAVARCKNNNRGTVRPHDL
ncbi:MAG: hypothetical protein ACYTG6_09970 [Planctomycetota bacterium]|jgi:hypothetical protein